MKNAIKNFFQCFDGSNLQRIEELENQVKNQNLQIKKIMNAMQSLESSVALLTTTVDTVVTVLNVPHPTEAAVQSCVNAVNAQVARLNDALSNMEKGQAPEGDLPQPVAPTP